MSSEAKAQTLCWYWRSISQANHTRIELCCYSTAWKQRVEHSDPVSKVHGANIGPTRVLSAPGGPHVDPKNLAIGKLFPCLWDALYIYLLFSTVLLTQLLWRSSAENGNITSRLDRDTAPFMDYTRTIDQILLQSDIQEVIYLNNGKIQP